MAKQLMAKKNNYESRLNKIIIGLERERTIAMMTNNHERVEELNGDIDMYYDEKKDYLLDMGCSFVAFV